MDALYSIEAHGDIDGDYWCTTTDKDLNRTIRECRECDKEDSDNDTQQYILKNLNSLGNSVDFWGRKNDRQHVIDGMSTTQKSQLLCYILRNHEAFGKMTCRDWKNWLLDDAEPQFGIWF